MYKGVIKRGIDLVTSVVLIVALSPVMLFIGVLLAATNRGKVWFFQERVGRGEKKFRIIKFKTMNDEIDASGRPLPDDRRLTTTGKWVRRLSLDELPQLFNVLRGSMSMVGPRPLLTEYLALYNEQQKKRHLVRPGITGWAQVNGRNTVEWRTRFEYDVWYVENLSFSLDIKILILTIIKVLKREGISSGRSVTMEKFRGGN